MYEHSEKREKKVFRLKRNKNKVFAMVTVVATCIILSNFLPIAHPQAYGSFVLPCTINTTGNAWSGYIAFDLEFNSAFMGVEGTSNYFVVINTDGTILALRKSPTSYGGAAYNIAPDTIMFEGEPQQDGASSAPTFATHFWNLTTGETQDFPNVISEHDIQYDPANNTFLALQQYVRPVGNNLYLIDKIVQLDPNGNVLWSWDPFNYLPLTEASAFNETSTYNDQTVIDFTHANTLDWHYNDSIIYLNCRNTNTFYKINQTTGQLIWACGEFGNFTLIGDNGKPMAGANGFPPSLWYHAHETKEVAPNVFLMFDNDFDNNTNPTDCRSRIMELTLNQTAMTAQVSWSWEAPTSYWNEYGGGAILLPNGDFLGDFGDPSHQFWQNAPWNFNDTGAVLVEVSPSGQVVRTFTFLAGCYIYRVESVTNPSSIAFANPPTPTPSPAPSPTEIINTERPVITPTPSPRLTTSPIQSMSSTPSVAPSSTSPASNNSIATILDSFIVASVVAVIGSVVAFYLKKSRSNKPKRNDA